MVHIFTVHVYCTSMPSAGIISKNIYTIHNLIYIQIDQFVYTFVITHTTTCYQNKTNNNVGEMTPQNKKQQKMVGKGWGWGGMEGRGVI
jgi:hypothetical protein